MLNKLLAWYEKNYALNVVLTAGLFSLQLIHLYWLTTDVVFFRIFETSLFPATGDLFKTFVVLVDYTEIPAIATTTILYIHLFLKTGRWKNILYLFLLNIQILHIFWITDEFVLETFGGAQTFSWNPLLAWVAIGIDYLELPVIFATIKEALIAVRKKLT